MVKHINGEMPQLVNEIITLFYTLFATHLLQPMFLQGQFKWPQDTLDIAAHMLYPLV